MRLGPMHPPPASHYPLIKQSHNSIGTLTPFGLTSKSLQMLNNAAGTNVYVTGQNNVWVKIF